MLVRARFNSFTFAPEVLSRMLCRPVPVRFLQPLKFKNSRLVLKPDSSSRFSPVTWLLSSLMATISGLDMSALSDRSAQLDEPILTDRNSGWLDRRCTKLSSTAQLSPDSCKISIPEILTESIEQIKKTIYSR